MGVEGDNYCHKKVRYKNQYKETPEWFIRILQLIPCKFNELILKNTTLICHSPLNRLPILPFFGHQTPAMLL